MIERREIERKGNPTFKSKEGSADLYKNKSLTFMMAWKGEHISIPNRSRSQSPIGYSRVMMLSPRLPRLFIKVPSSPIEQGTFTSRPIRRILCLIGIVTLVWIMIDRKWEAVHSE